MPTRAPRHTLPRSRPKDVRPSATQRGYDARWQRYRAWFLAQPQNVLCAACRREVATVVDHIRPHKGDHDRFWDAQNHQPLCKSCHDRKTATEDGGFGRK